MGEAEIVDGCVPRAARQEKQASGIVVYLMEELGDARLRTAQLKTYVQEVVDLIEKSKHRDEFFEVAGHLIHGIPDTVFKIDKALDAASLAAARLDYEEIKQNLKPEKADELEAVLKDVRLQYLKRRSNEGATDPQTAQLDNPMRNTTMKNAKEAADELVQLAKITETTGQIPLARLAKLIGSLEGPRARMSSDMPKKASQFFTQAAATLRKETNPSRTRLAGVLRRVYADGMQMDAGTMLSAIFSQSNSREDVIKGFQSANPSMSDEDANKAADMWEKHQNVVKDKHQ